MVKKWTYDLHWEKCKSFYNENFNIGSNWSSEIITLKQLILAYVTVFVKYMLHLEKFGLLKSKNRFDLLTYYMVKMLLLIFLELIKTLTSCPNPPNWIFTFQSLLLNKKVKVLKAEWDVFKKNNTQIKKNGKSAENRSSAH